MSNYLEGVSMNVLQKSLDAVWLRQQVISNNIANSETPGYKTKSIEFENIFKDLLNDNYDNISAVKRAIENIEPVLTENSTASTKEDGNSVNLDYENIELARAQIQYDYLISSLTSQINRLKYAINGGK
ncbi:MAG: flagellar basal-body rod protein FlgB [Clostridiales bacterium GWF2_36_10]|nr:MAG: flagellar basal-body rod protein FlgB [Clostridiales bacterium GWF2_36_10]HAN20864.1 flagellar basal body rod protein FlgB [Clostridiales bacterium]